MSPTASDPERARERLDFALSRSMVSYGADNFAGALEERRVGFAVTIARAVMNLWPSEPTWKKGFHLSEIVNHRQFLDASSDEQEEILLALAKRHYNEDRDKPFEHYYPGYDFPRLLVGKTILDLGCWCGGKTVSYAEKWKPAAIYGMDVNEQFIRAARLFAAQRAPHDVAFDFRVAFGEALPYPDRFFDAIVSWDVFEHVQSLAATLAECKRVLKPGGLLFAVFPSYYEPIGGAHLRFVTHWPCLHWIFSPETLNAAYRDILAARGEERTYWYRSNVGGDGWQTLQGGIGINGTTFRKYRVAAQDAGFSDVRILPTPLFSVGRLSLRFPVVKAASGVLRPLLRFERLQDYLSHRIVSVLAA